MIEDEELRHLYKISSEEHVQKLEAGILSLEKNPQDMAPFKDLMREAHSLKGDSRMLGVNGVETLSHQIEHILGNIQKGETSVTPELCDRIYHALDAIAKLVEEAVTGEASNVDTFHILATLMGADKPPEVAPPAATVPPPETPAAIAEAEEPQDTETTSDRPASIPEVAVTEPPVPMAVGEEEAPEGEGETAPPAPESVPEPPPEIATQPLPKTVGTTPVTVQAKTFTPISTAATSPSPADSTPTKTGEPYRISTIRVETSHLDALMTQTGELTVTKIRMSHTADAVEKLLTLWEEWKNSDRQRLQRSQAPDSPTQTLDYEEQVNSAIHHLRVTAQENNARLENIAVELEEKVRTLRLLPLSTVFQIFPRMVRDLSREQGKKINLMVEGGETAADKRILEEIKDPLMHMVRNAIDHGIETPEERKKKGKPAHATIYLRGYQTATNIFIEVEDDGRGLDLEKIRQTAIKKNLYRPEELDTMSDQQIYGLIFAPGFTTRNFITEVSGRGVGLDVVNTNVEKLKGSIQVESALGKGCKFRIQLGTTLATANVLLVAVQGITHAIPIEFVETTLLVSPDDIFTIEARETIALGNQAVSVAYLDQLLELSAHQKFKKSAPMDHGHGSDRALPCILLKIGEEKFGLFVDRLLDTQDVVIKPQSKLLKRVRNVTGATILGTGEVCMILNPQDLLRSIQKSTGQFVPSQRRKHQEDTPTQKSRPVVLLAEDSIATRTQEKRILEAAGYEVVTAVDGLDGWNKLTSRHFDALISDIQMPNLDGLELTEKVRKHDKYLELPIVLVTSLASDEDKRRGAEAGANAYITKDKFNQDVLIDTLNRLI